MSQQIPFYFRMCATCEYWTGTRSADTFGNYSEVDNGQPTGRCMCRQSAWFRNTPIAQNCCSSYERWSAMKK